MTMRRQPRPQSSSDDTDSRIRNDATEVSMISYCLCVLRIWDSVADPSNYTDNIASSSSSPSWSLYVIDKLNEPTNWRKKHRFNAKMAQQKREPPHCVCVPVHSVYEIGNFRLGRRHTTHNTTLTEILKVNAFSVHMYWQLRARSPLKHMYERREEKTKWTHKKVDEKERKKKIWIAFLVFIVVRLGYCWMHFATEATAHRRRRLENILVCRRPLLSNSVAKEDRLNKSHRLL